MRPFLVLNAVINESGPEHDKIFTLEVRINKKVLGEGTGRTKKEAEQSAAKEALKKLSAFELWLKVDENLRAWEQVNEELRNNRPDPEVSASGSAFFDSRLEQFAKETGVKLYALESFTSETLQRCEELRPADDLLFADVYRATTDYAFNYWLECGCDSVSVAGSKNDVLVIA